MQRGGLFFCHSYRVLGIASSQAPRNDSTGKILRLRSLRGVLRRQFDEAIPHSRMSDFIASSSASNSFTFPGFSDAILFFSPASLTRS